MAVRLRALAMALLTAIALMVGPAAFAADPGGNPQQARDEAVVRAALAARTFEALAQHMPALRQVLDKAPTSFPLVEQRGDLTIVREDGQTPAFVLALLVTAAAEKRNTRVVREFNTYPLAALLLASYATEMKQPAQALAILDMGLKIQPGNSGLVSEKAAALFLLGRAQEGTALVSAWLEANALADDVTRARLLRSKGYGLTELKDLDGAEAAYRESLKLEPGHKGALYEVDYIGKLKAGGQRLGGEITTSDKAKTEDVKPHPAGEQPKL